MGCGDGCLLNDEGYRAIEGSSRPPLINLTVPSEEPGTVQRKDMSFPPTPLPHDSYRRVATRKR